MKKRYIKWTLVAIWAIVIFLFSCQNGSSSGNNNKIIIEIFRNMGINLDALLGGYGNFIIRKLAHLTEFFILYYLIFNALSIDFSFKKCLLLSLVLTFLYAGSDEFHQIFVSGRGPSFRDVMIDTGGGALCMLIKVFIYPKRSLTNSKVA